MKYPRSKYRLTWSIDPWVYGCEQDGPVTRKQARDGVCHCGREVYDMSPYYIGTRKWVKRIHAIRLQGAA